MVTILVCSFARLCRITWIVPVIVVVIGGCADRRPATAAPPDTEARAIRVLDAREGLASYYGTAFHGRVTASGAPFDMNAMVAAHPTYPFGTLVRVTNLRNGRSRNVRILDRGPAAGPRGDGVIIDLSHGAADALGFLSSGRARVRIEVLRWGR